jgi:hypothetical protein
MKKYISYILYLVLPLQVFSQAAWIEPKNPDVTKTIRIYCDIDKATAATADAMKANPAGPFYIWTWKPTEGATIPNGEGDKPWKNSSEGLKMTKDVSKGANVWYYEMVATTFYNVSASEVYTAGISFLVKPKDGGGYGEDDIKTEDFNLAVAPPKVDRGLVYPVPATMYEDQITSIVYDNPADKNAAMQNLQNGDVYLYLKATIKDTATQTTTTIEPTKFFQVHTNSRLMMKKMSDGRFKLSMIPQQFFNVPAGSIMVSVIVIARKAQYTGPSDQTTSYTLNYGCQ